MRRSWPSMASFHVVSALWATRIWGGVAHRADKGHTARVLGEASISGTVRQSKLEVDIFVHLRMQRHCYTFAIIAAHKHASGQREATIPGGIGVTRCLAEAGRIHGIDIPWVVIRDWMPSNHPRFLVCGIRDVMLGHQCLQSCHLVVGNQTHGYFVSRKVCVGSD